MPKLHEGDTSISDLQLKHVTTTIDLVEEHSGDQKSHLTTYHNFIWGQYYQYGYFAHNKTN